VHQLWQGRALLPADQIEFLSRIEEKMAPPARFVANLIDASWIEAGGLKAERDLSAAQRASALPGPAA
jgi:K+-sensing histidine kinase KdpD